MMHIPCEILLYKYRHPTWNKVRFWYSCISIFRFILRMVAATYLTVFSIKYSEANKTVLSLPQRSCEGCYLHIWPFDVNKILSLCFFFSDFCWGRTKVLTTWWLLGDNHNKYRLRASLLTSTRVFRNDLFISEELVNIPQSVNCPE